MNFTFYLLAFFLFVPVSVSAVTVEIVYRPILTYATLDRIAQNYFGFSDFTSLGPSHLQMLDDINLMDPYLVGHVAVRLPEGATPGGRVWGWEPIEDQRGRKLDSLALNEQIAALKWLKGEPVGRSVRGQFVSNDEWIKKGVLDRAMAVPLELTDFQLKEMVGLIENINADSSYRFQLFPMEITFNRFVFPDKGANCVLAAIRLVQRSGIHLPFAEPQDGDMLQFQKSAQSKAHPVREFTCSDKDLRARFLLD